MAKVKQSGIEKAVPVTDDENEATLAAIDEGLRDAKAGRSVPAEDVRMLLPKWIAGSSKSAKRSS